MVRRVKTKSLFYATYFFIDDANYLYCEADFEKYGVTYCKYLTILEHPDFPHLNIIFCKIKKKEILNFERAMKSLESRLKILRPASAAMEKQLLEGGIL